MERRAFRVPGFVMLLVLLIEVVATVVLFGAFASRDQGPGGVAVAIVGGLGFILLASGFLVPRS